MVHTVFDVLVKAIPQQCGTSFPLRSYHLTFVSLFYVNFFHFLFHVVLLFGLMRVDLGYTGEYICFYTCLQILYPYE
jgi:hypothetical protein